MASYWGNVGSRKEPEMSKGLLNCSGLKKKRLVTLEEIVYLKSLGKMQGNDIIVEPVHEILENKLLPHEISAW